jgi:meiotically up-regulated gene 157 (Mug157) protein
MRGLTSTNENEIIACIKLLNNSHANTGFMHESFDKDDAAKFSRPWFAWANTLLGEFILMVKKEYPHLLQKQF